MGPLERSIQEQQARVKLRRLQETLPVGFERIAEFMHVTPERLREFASGAELLDNEFFAVTGRLNEFYPEG